MKFASNLLAPIVMLTLLAGCAGKPSEEQNTAAEATSPPAAVATTEATQPVSQPPATELPYGETTASQVLSNMGVAPKSMAPELVRANPKELSLADSSDYELLGFNLENVKVFARQAGKPETQLQPRTRSGEMLSIPAAEWKKLPAGNYDIVVLGNDDTVSTLPVQLNIE